MQVNRILRSGKQGQDYYACYILSSALFAIGFLIDFFPVACPFFSDQLYLPFLYALNAALGHPPV
jgi:hypothetical protein